MLLKIVTQQSGGPKSIDCHHVFDGIEDIQVEDYFYDLGRPREAMSEVLHAGDVNMYFDYKETPGCGSSVGNHAQQQVLIFHFTSRGKRCSIASEMPAYLMNDQGKTIEHYYPARG